MDLPHAFAACTGGGGLGAASAPRQDTLAQVGVPVQPAGPPPPPYAPPPPAAGGAGLGAAYAQAGVPVQPYFGLPAPPPPPPAPVPAFPPAPSVLDRVLAADNARKRAADERNASFVAERLASARSMAALAGAALHAAQDEPEISHLGAAMLQRASKQPRSRAGARAPGRSSHELSVPAQAGVVPTNVYALGVPTEAAQAEVELFFSRVGPISRVKLYAGADGLPKGDALVTYRTAGGAEAALRLLHGRHVRPGPGATPVSLSLATFEHKLSAAPPEPPPPAPPPPQPAPGSVELAQLMARTIVIRHVFTADDVAAAPSEAALVGSVKDDLWMECCKCGELEQIAVHARGPALGAATVRFEGALPAAEAVDLMDGRFFCERRLEASFWDGDASLGCELATDSARQLQFGFGKAAAQQAAAAAGDARHAGARAAQGRADAGAGDERGSGVSGSVAAEERASQLRAFMAEVGGDRL